MRKFIWTFLLISILGFSQVVKAALYDRGGGLIYDDVLDVTWLQDANYAATSGYDDSDSLGRMNWDDAMAWAGQLEYYDSARDIVWDDWRLPRTQPINPNDWVLGWGYDGTSDEGYNITSPNSEMAYMFYVNLNNSAYYGTNGYGPQENWGLQNTGLFVNLQSATYWSETVYPENWLEAFYFDFEMGDQGPDNKNEINYAWAVRGGDVPIPGALWLLGSGLIALVGLRKRLKR
jgi:hypothetical protein